MKTSAMHRPLMGYLLVSCLLRVGNVHAVDNEAQPQSMLGKQTYEAWCEACHGPGPGRYGRGLTGTEALEAKYDGKLPAVLDERTDLTPEFVAAVVRHGISMMPFFRRTEISDTELAALGAYLSRLNPQVHPQPAARP